MGEQQVSIPNVPDLAWPLHDLQRCPCMSQHPWHPKEPHPGSAGPLCCLSTWGFSGITLCCTDSGGAWWLFSRTWGVFSFQQNHRFFEEGPVLYMHVRAYLAPKAEGCYSGSPSSGSPSPFLPVSTFLRLTQSPLCMSHASHGSGLRPAVP